VNRTTETCLIVVAFVAFLVLLYWVADDVAEMILRRVAG